jgi:hypothetical protein
MPTLEITTSAATPSDREVFLLETSKLIAEMLNKPEKVREAPFCSLHYLD